MAVLAPFTFPYSKEPSSSGRAPSSESPPLASASRCSIRAISRSRSASIPPVPSGSSMARRKSPSLLAGNAWMSGVSFIARLVARNHSLKGRNDVAMKELGNTVIVMADSSAHHERVDVRDDLVEHLPAAVRARVGEGATKSRWEKLDESRSRRPHLGRREDSAERMSVFVPGDVVDRRLSRRLCEPVVVQGLP
jgi:hypothetical protein